MEAAISALQEAERQLVTLRSIRRTSPRRSRPRVPAPAARDLDVRRPGGGGGGR